MQNPALHETLKEIKSYSKLIVQGITRLHTLSMFPETITSEAALTLMGDMK